MKKTNNKGFSLVELIIVIAIMAVLIGVLAPQFIKYVERSRESTDLQNIEELKTAVEAYVADNGEKFTTSTANITVALTVSGGKSTITVAGGPSDMLTDADGLKAYGITEATKPGKSAKWPNFTWTYDVKAYSWTCSPDPKTNGADYFHIDGTVKTSSAGGASASA
ncbi:MAG: type II secretion system protein [Lachnospiraceae bacterium]|nr:type II secretion system protein [Lachnospiraceae bacterium]